MRPEASGSLYYSDLRPYLDVENMLSLRNGKLKTSPPCRNMHALTWLSNKNHLPCFGVLYDLMTIDAVGYLSLAKGWCFWYDVYPLHHSRKKWF
jgi:hypothetical protein